jgi:1-aminocyclopropane-1-carboxylate deaminase
MNEISLYFRGMIPSLAYTATPVQEIHDPLMEKAGVRLLVKREDLNHPLVSGNKWWKLKYNLEQAQKQGLDTLLTFGGAFSNHIYATAGAAAEKNMKSIGIIRGEETLPLNATLAFAQNQGMQLHYISRSEYRKKSEPEFSSWLHQRFGDFYLIPEGGSNALAVKGCAEFGTDHLSAVAFDYLCLPVGTGGTLAGVVAAFKGSKEILGISVLKNGHFLQSEVSNLVHIFSGNFYGNWTVLTSYDHGGYAKVTKELLDFVSAMKDQYNLPLDHVYTGKLLWAVMKEAIRGRFTRGSTVLALHTGGLQGALRSA